MQEQKSPNEIWLNCPAYVNAGRYSNKCGFTKAETIIEIQHPECITQRPGPLYFDECRQQECLLVKIYSQLRVER